MVATPCQNRGNVVSRPIVMDEHFVEVSGPGHLASPLPHSSPCTTGQRVDVPEKTPDARSTLTFGNSSSTGPTSSQDERDLRSGHSKVLLERGSLVETRCRVGTEEVREVRCEGHRSKVTGRVGTTLGGPGGSGSVVTLIRGDLVISRPVRPVRPGTSNTRSSSTVPGRDDL